MSNRSANDFRSLTYNASPQFCSFFSVRDVASKSVHRTLCLRTDADRETNVVVGLRGGRGPWIGGHHPGGKFVQLLAVRDKNMGEK